VISACMVYVEDTNLESKDSNTKSGRQRVALQQAEEEERLEREGAYDKGGPVHFQLIANEPAIMADPPSSFLQRVRKGLMKLRVN